VESLPINLLIFPLVGGYYITTRCESAKYVSQRITSQAIFFNAVLVGILLMAISLALTTGATYFLNLQVEWVKSHLFPLKDEFFGTCLLSVLLAFCYTKYKNWRIQEAKFILRAIEQIGNELELMVAYSFQESKLIQVTLRSDKVYIGWAEVLPRPSHNQYVQIIPLLSGYRDEKKELIITTNYSQVYSELILEGKMKEIRDVNMSLVIMADEIITASRFDFDIFERFSKKEK
jgi:hypothetical protein